MVCDLLGRFVRVKLLHSQDFNVGSTLFQCSDVENETKYDVGFSTDLRKISKQHCTMLTLIQCCFNVIST